MLKRYFSLVKFAHTLFALPFAILGFVLGMQERTEGWSWQLFGLVLLCMVFARSAAMAYNRYLDRDIDALNQRTARRELPAGLLTPRAVLLFVLINSVLFILTTWFINPLCFYLSPVALFIVLGYSYTKRFSWLCHFFLGLGLALAPMGAYLAAGGSFDLLPMLYAGTVLCWVAGFDIIYALQDADFDRQHALYSVPAAFGASKALGLSRILHLACATLLIIAAYQTQAYYPAFGIFLSIGTLLFVALLVYQHTLVKANDLSRVNLAFFTTNGLASVLLSIFFVLDIFV